jgi:hypothetical protein
VFEFVCGIVAEIIPGKAVFLPVHGLNELFLVVLEQVDMTTCFFRLWHGVEQDEGGPETFREVVAPDIFVGVEVLDIFATFFHFAFLTGLSSFGLLDEFGVG